jgi:hypothetical protein
LASVRWQQLDPHDPGRVLGEDVLRSVRGKLKWVHHSPLNGNGLNGNGPNGNGKEPGPRLSHDA